MIYNKKTDILKVSSLIIALLFSQKAAAAGFTISSSSTSQQILGSGEVGLVNLGATLNVNDYAVILSSSNGARLTNNGTIKSLKDGTNVVIEGGSSNVILNNGEIILEGIGASAIMSFGVNAKITNTGSIDTLSAASEGIYSLGSNSVITNSGSILSRDSYGITMVGSNSVLTSSGYISGAVNGVILEGENSTLNNTGSIFGKQAGVYLSVSAILDKTIINSGSIFSEGIAIESSSQNLKLINSGTITASGNGAGIIARGGGTLSITNSGTITASVSGPALYSEAITAYITNSGTITGPGFSSTISGFPSAVISLSDDNTYLTNSGKIIASSGSKSAILGGTGSQELTIEKGSEIIGTINLGAGADSLTISGINISGRLSTSNVESLSIGAKVAGVVIGGDVYTVDATGAAMLSLGVNKLALNVQNSISSHRGQASVNKEQSPMWVNVFNSEFDRKAESENLAYKNQTSGFIGGYDLDHEKSTGLIFGVSSSSLATKSTSFKTDVNSFFLGGYKNINLAKSTSLNFDLIAGYEKYQSQRSLIDNIYGHEVATSNFNNLFLAPSATLEHKFKITESFELNPMAKLSYTSALFGGSDETGSTAANMKTKSRTVKVLNSRIGVNAVLNLQNTKFELGIGFDRRTIKEGQVSASIRNQNFKYSTNNDKSVNGHYIRAAAYIIDLKNFSLVGSFEKRKAGGGENEYFGQIGAGYRF